MQFDASVQVVNLRQPRLQRAQRVLLQEMLLRSDRSFQLWLSPELMMFSSFARVVLPQLLLAAIVHVFFPLKIVLLLSLTCSLGWALELLLSSLCQDHLAD